MKMLRHAMVVAVIVIAGTWTHAASISAALPDTVEFAFKSYHPDGEYVHGTLLTPIGDGPFPAVIMLHGCAGPKSKTGKLRKRPLFWSTHLRDAGYVVLVIDSFGPRGYRSICAKSDRPISPFKDRPYDVWAGLKLLQDQPALVRTGRIALIGWSHGAMTGLKTLHKDRKTRPEGLNPGFRAGVFFYPGCISLGRQGYETEIPTMVHVGMNDDWTRPGPCIDLVASAVSKGSPMTILTYPGAHHGFDMPDTPVRARTARNASWRTGERTVHSGTHPEARQAAVSATLSFLKRELGD